MNIFIIYVLLSIINSTVASPPTVIPPQSPPVISESITHIKLTSTYSPRSGPDEKVIDMELETPTLSIISTSISKSKQQQTEKLLVRVLIALWGILICCCFLLLIVCSKSKSSNSSTPGISIGNINKTSPVRPVDKSNSQTSPSQEYNKPHYISSKAQSMSTMIKNYLSSQPITVDHNPTDINCFITGTKPRAKLSKLSSFVQVNPNTSTINVNMRNTGLSMDVDLIGTPQLERYQSEWKTKSYLNTNVNTNMEQTRNRRRINLEIEHSTGEPGSVLNVGRVDCKGQAFQLMEMKKMIKLASDSPVVTKMTNTGLSIAIDDEERMDHSMLTPTDNVCAGTSQSATDQYESKDTDNTDRSTPITYAYTDEGSSSLLDKQMRD